MAKTRKSPTRWRKKKPSGRGVCSGPIGEELVVAGEVVMHVEYDRKRQTWYWYGMGHNSLPLPCPTLISAKILARNYYDKVTKQAAA